MILRSPAKVNLFLHILGKRRDGYHELASLFQAVSLFDDIKLVLSDVDTFVCNIENLQNPDNLAVKARELFRIKTGIDQPLSISVQKKIPLEAGLGGGSSNAATVLWGMNQLFGCPVKESNLQSWSKELGSDVPFFFSFGSAYCKGRGEKVKNIEPLHSQKLTIVKPEVSLSTKDVYSYMTNITAKNSDELLDRFLSGNPQYENDLEAAAFRLCPKLKEVKSSLLARFPNVLLCGSGSSFFCIGNDEDFPNGIPVEFINRQNGRWYY